MKKTRLLIFSAFMLVILSQIPVFSASMTQVFDAIIDSYREKLSIEISLDEQNPSALDKAYESYESYGDRMFRGLQKTDSPVAIDYFIKRVSNLDKVSQMAFIPILKKINENILSSVQQGISKDMSISFNRLDMISQITDSLKDTPPDESDINNFIAQKGSASISESSKPSLKDTSEKQSSSKGGLYLTVLKSDAEHAELKVSFPAPMYAKIVKENKTFRIPYIKDCGYTSKIGFPMLPVLRFFLALPQGAKVSSDIIDSSKRVLTNMNPYPVQPPLLDIKGYIVPFTIDKNAYKSSKLWPAKTIKTKVAGKIRDFKILLVEINPFRFKASDKSVSIVEEITFTVNFNSSKNNNTPMNARFRDAVNTSSGSADFNGIYKNMFLNSDQILSDSHTTRDVSTLRDSEKILRQNPVNGAEYLIIAHDEFYEAVKPLAKWKNKRGLYSKIVKMSDIPGSDDPENIKKFVKKCYLTFDPKPSYLLLVGDCEQIPTFHRVMPTYGAMFGGPIGSDHYYSMVDGKDLFSDIFVGRLSATSANEVTTMVNKIIAYEKNPYMQDRGWFKRALSAGFKQDGRIFHETAIAVKDFLTAQGLKCFKAFSWEGDTTDNILSAFEQGINIITYRGHGESAGWVEPGFSIDDAETLSNGSRLPVMLSTTCLSGSYDDPDFDCFGEGLLKQNSGGVSSFLGASKPSYSFYNDEFLLGMLRSIYKENTTIFGQIISRGQSAMVKKYGLDKKSEDMFEFYSVLGDPSLKVWTDTPSAIKIKCNAKISSTTKRFMVEISSNSNPISKARVTLASPDYKQYYRARITNSNGRCAFVIPPELNCDNLELTVTGDNIIPNEKSITVNR